MGRGSGSVEQMSSKREPKNIERFLAATMPKVRSSRLDHLWRFYDVPYGIEVPYYDGTGPVGSANEPYPCPCAAIDCHCGRHVCNVRLTRCVPQPVRMYFVPYLSGMRLLKKRGVTAGGLQRSASVGTGEGSEPEVVFQYYEYERVQDRLPFAMKIQELQQQVRFCIEIMGMSSPPPVLSSSACCLCMHCRCMHSCRPRAQRNIPPTRGTASRGSLSILFPACRIRRRSPRAVS